MKLFFLKCPPPVKILTTKCLAVGAIMLGLDLNLHGQVIRYDFSLVGSGTIGSTSFNNQTIDFSVLGNAADVAWDSDLLGYADQNATGNVTVGGFGTAALTGALTLSDRSVQGNTSASDVAFSCAGSGQYTIYGSPFFNYDLTSALGPVLGSATYLDSRFGTSDGDLDFSLSPASPFTFQAEVIGSVPEPAAWSLVAATSLLAVSFGRQFRRNQA